jgi:NhaP-type Na+/H+ or K+/H+ antiporter
VAEDHLSVVIVAIVAVGVLAQWIAWRSRLPAIVLLAACGLLLGPVFGVVDPSAEFGGALRPMVGLCVAIILFEGGLSLDLSDLKVAAQGVRRLVYLGAPLAWGTATLAGHYIGGLSWGVAVVLGAIMVVTGPTVIIPMLRQAGLNRRTASYLKWEGIINDPIGALLAVLAFQFLLLAGEGSPWPEVFTGLALAVGSAALLGGLGGWLVAVAFLRGMVPEYLKSPVLLGAVLVVYVASNALQHDAGLLAVTVMGIVVANMHLPGIQDMKRFKEYITVMLVSAVFVILTADLDAQLLLSLAVRDIALVGALLFVTRPVSIMLATFGTTMQFNDRLLLAWIAPRGIVAAATAGVMGPGLVAAGYADAERLLPLVFAVIFATVLLHGGSIAWIARRLGLASPMRDSVLIIGASPWSTELARKLNDSAINVLVADSSWNNLRAARLAGIPVFYGEILSEFAEESVEITHVAGVLAATSNDAYNALVCKSFAPEIGQRNVYQLAMGGGDKDPRGVARPLRGRLAFGQDIQFERLWRWHVRGWQFSKTTLTESYSYSDFLGDAHGDSVAILSRSGDGQLRFSSPDSEFEPGPGDTIFFYGPERLKEEPAAADNDVTLAPVAS